MTYNNVFSSGQILSDCNQIQILSQPFFMFAKKISVCTFIVLVLSVSTSFYCLDLENFEKLISHFLPQAAAITKIVLVCDIEIWKAWPCIMYYFGHRSNVLILLLDIKENCKTSMNTLTMIKQLILSRFDRSNKN